MQISKREITLIIVCVVVVIAAVFFVMTPATPGGAKKGQLTLKDATEKLATMKSSEAQMKREQQQMTPRIQQMSYTQPAEELMPQIIQTLQNSAAKSGVHLREVKPLRPRLIAGGTGARVPLEVRFRTTFQPNAVKFLYMVEDPANRMVVDKINITSADAKFKTVEVAAQITVFTRSSVGVSGTEGGETTNAKAKKS